MILMVTRIGPCRNCHTGKSRRKIREQGISRYDLGREKFVEQVWEWKEEYASHIREQWAKMGLSLDYSRERFTLDDGLSEAVRKVFVSLYEKDLIYRGEYIINWALKHVLLYQISKLSIKISKVRFTT